MYSQSNMFLSATQNIFNLRLQYWSW